MPIANTRASLAALLEPPPPPAEGEALDRYLSSLEEPCDAPIAWVLCDREPPMQTRSAPLPCVWVLPPDGVCDFNPSSLTEVAEPTLLRVVARLEASPALDWAIGRKCVRLLETERSVGGYRAARDIGFRGNGEMGDGSERGRLLDLLLSVPDDDLEDVEDTLRCAVGGEALRRGRAAQTPLLAMHRVNATNGDVLVLPECCRGAVAAGVVPRAVGVLWRVSCTTDPTAMKTWMTDDEENQRAILTRCAYAGDSGFDENVQQEQGYWIDAPDAARASAIAARALPRGASWFARVRGTATPAGDGATSAGGAVRAVPPPRPWPRRPAPRLPSRDDDGLCSRPPLGDSCDGFDDHDRSSPLLCEGDDDEWREGVRLLSSSPGCRGYVLPFGVVRAQHNDKGGAHGVEGSG